MLLQYIASYVEKDFILFVKTRDIISPREFQIRTKFPKYSYDFTIGISERDAPDTTSEELTKSVGQWFDSVGHFHQEAFLADVRVLLKNFGLYPKHD